MASPRRRASSEDSDEVTLKLAHPLNENNPFTGKAEGVNEEVTLDRQSAAALIASGYAQVDPGDPAAVAEALGIPAAGELTAGGVADLTPAE